MPHTIRKIRKWSPSRDCVAIDYRGSNKQQRAIYHHQWGTGHQTLVFDTPEEAAKYEASLNTKP